MKVEPITLEGRRVKLVPISPIHIEGLIKAGQAPEIWPYMPYPVNSRESAEIFIREAIAEQEAGQSVVFTIIDKESDQIAGSTRYLEIVSANRGLEIGWTWINPSFWRTRVNSECKYLLLRHAFEECGAIRVQLKADSRNERSCTAIARLGAQYEGKLRNHRILRDGYFRDTVYFSILDREWSGVKDKLERVLKEV
ncbi:GNAT family N-acetyltransferase [Ammoniphilus sp. CFH 90114]|uniref:GNAT family N-acetyltransferase n=1 Tax=Ammoniphilus sp. CFH 90114 TaxID=2493665 RepID=UPI00100FC588|nr:GNAT family protein [Ammoniphilus sp. CFH 90114]RXT04942.1 N-acetyltransferase [Ammoniphilus sp. CFH 90114]